MCPGGYTLLPEAGFFAVLDQGNKASRTTIQCDPPNLERCSGFRFNPNEPVVDLTSNAQQWCGEGYTNFACRACSERYFEDDDVTCKACPPSESFAFATVALPLLLICACSLFFTGVCIALARHLELPLTYAVKRSVKFLVYVSQCLS